MPPRTTEYPPMVRPFVAHGVPVDSQAGEEWCAECPFCEKKKFYLHVPDGKWQCKVCGEEGNVYRFLQRVWEVGVNRTTESDYASLEKNRGVPSEFLREYGLVLSPLTHEWIAPGYGVTGALVNLYRWKQCGGESRAMMPTPGGDLHHGYFRPTTPPENYEFVEWVEGVWDACARRWALSQTDPGRAARTLVVATPGANVWVAGWGNVSSGRPTAVLFDNDHPRRVEKTGKVSQPAWEGSERLVRALCGYESPPSFLRVLQWGPGGYDPELSPGYDLRDVSRDHNGTAVGFVDGRVGPVPQEWMEPKDHHSSKGTPVPSPKNDPLRAEECTSWDELRAAWKGAIHYTEEFELGLIFALTVAASVTYGRDRLWGRMIGVPGSGKSMICNGLSTSTKHCETESVIKGFYSGTRTEDGTDHSFAARLRDRLWINNDADTLRTIANREELFAQLRDLYGGKGSKAFHNGLGSRSYNNLRFGVLFAATDAIREIDSADLGSRFLDFCFDKPDFETRRLIARSAMRSHTGTHDASSMSPELKRATQLTGGYLEHLRRTWDDKDTGIRLSEEHEDTFHMLSEYVAVMRGRPPRNQEEQVDSTEMPTRLSTQLCTVAVYSALVRGRSRIDLGSLSLVRRVACDTAKGRTEEIVKNLARAGSIGLDMRGILGVTRNRPESEYDLVSYLVRVGVLEETPTSVRVARWRLSEWFRDIYRRVYPSSIRGE